MANIVLFALSTYSRSLQMNDFIVDGGEQKVVENCISQLEPPIRTFLNQFHDSDRGFLEDDTYLIMLCTKKSRDGFVQYSKETKNDQTEKDVKDKKEIALNKVTKELYENKITHGEFLINRLLGNPNNKPILRDDCEGYSKNNEEGYEQYSIDKDGKHFECRIIQYDPEHTMNAIEKIVAYYRKLDNKQKNSSNDKNHLFVAANGGLRDDYITLILIVKLLGIDNVIPEKILSTEMGDSRRVISAEKGFRLLDYAFGLHNFFKSGDASGLQEYFTEVNQINTDDSLIKAMNNISKGARYCNAETIEKGLNSIRDTFVNEKEESNISNTPEFRIFSDNIHNDYGEKMLKDTKDNVETIRWCIRKDLLQQALTIAESKTGDDMNQHGILSFEDGDSIVDDLKDKAEYGQKCSPYMADAPHHMLFNDFVYQMYKEDKMGPKNRKKAKDSSFILKDIDDKRFDIKEIVNSSTVDSQKVFIKNLRAKFSNNTFNFLCINSEFDRQPTFLDEYKDKKTNKDVPLQEINIFKNEKSLSKEIKLKAKILLKLLVYLYHAIKTERNNMNHAGAKIPDSEKLKALLNAYCDVAEALYTLVDPQ